MGRLSEAKTCFDHAVGLQPDFAEAHYNLANTLLEMGRLIEAEASYKNSIALKPDYFKAHNNLGNTQRELSQLTEAEGSYINAIALKPDYAEAHNNLGSLLKAQGRLSEAEASFKQAITLKADYAAAYFHLTQIKKLDVHDAEFLQMLDLYADNDLSDEHRCQINFGLAKVNEDLGNFQQAFTHYVEGNELRKKLQDYCINQDVELFAKIKTSHPRLEKCSLPQKELERSVKPIFIVGMPRSGTSLIEQIVSSHRLVTGAGELPYVELLGSAMATGFSDLDDQALLNFRNSYLDRLEGYSEGNLWVTDKMPYNFRYVGLLATAFPEAKFIHVKRRPEAICWGNFKNYFPAKNLGYAWAIDDIVAYFKLYQNLMEFWQTAFNHRIYNLDYELLTDNQEPETRNLIDFIGLGWDENCLYPEENTRSVLTASSLQVRQKVYRGSSDQWKKYEPFLSGAFANLSV